MMDTTLHDKDYSQYVWRVTLRHIRLVTQQLQSGISHMWELNLNITIESI